MTERSAKRPATVRLSAQSQLHLREMAAQEGVPMCAVLEKAWEQYQRQRFWREMDVAYAALQQDPEAWADDKAGLDHWAATLLDGLDPDEVWTAGGAAHFMEEKAA